MRPSKRAAAISISHHNENDNRKDGANTDMERQNELKGRRKVSPKEMGRILGRVLKYMVSSYKWQFAVVVVCIFGAALATRRGTLFMQDLIDDYILPLTQTPQPDFGPLAGALCTLAGIYCIGIICSYTYNRIMVNVSQGTMKKLRDQLFSHMESLPIRYFDTHAHGDIMSVYTNDVDTLRQLMSQSIPQVINSVITMATTAVSMILLSPLLTVLSLLMVCVMAFWVDFHNCPHW